MVASARKSTVSPAFQFYPKDFLTSSKVLAMTPAEVGIYIKLLCICWLDGSLSPDLKVLAKLAGITERVMRGMWTALTPCFFERNGRLYNRRLERERKVQADYRAKKQAAAAARWSDKQEPCAASLVHDQMTESAYASLPQSSSASAVSDPQKTQSARPQSLVKPRRKDAAWEGLRVYVPQRIHSDFVGYRNHAGAEIELFTWYEAVSEEWTTGARRDEDLEPDMLKFWRARYAERWPPSVARKSGQPAWMTEAV